MLFLKLVHMEYQPNHRNHSFVLLCHCNPQEGVEGGAPLPGDFRLIVCLTTTQMNDFGDLIGTPYAPVSKIAPVKGMVLN